MNDAWAIILVAIITAVVTSVTARWSSRNEQRKISQEMVSILGTERQNLSNDLERVKKDSRELVTELTKVQDELLQVKEEYALAKIEHRQAIAEKDLIIKERDQALNDQHAATASVMRKLDEATALLDTQSNEIQRERRARQEGLELISEQARELARLRARLPHSSG